MTPPRLSRRGPVAALCLSLALGGWALSGSGPRVLGAAEVDTLEGGVRFAEALTASSGDGLRARLVEGFRTFPDHPRLDGVPPAGRDALLPPAPRWLAAIGVMLAPVPEETSNGGRASFAAAVVAALALALILAGRAWASSLSLLGLALATVSFTDALTGFSYGSVGMLASSLLLVGLRTPRSPRASLFAALACACGLALALGTHPFAASLLLVPLLLPRGAVGGEPRPLPWGALVAPLLGVALLVALWPSLWSRTGPGLAAWLLGAGLEAGPVGSVLAQSFDPSRGEGPQGFTALLQLVTAFPLPLLLLAVYGARVATVELRAPLGCLAALLLAAILDGGLFGARLNLMPLLLPHVLVCAAAALDHLGARARRIGLLAACCALALRLSGAGLEPWVPGSERLEALTGTPADPPSRAADVARAVARDHLERRDE
jgi:hypothetical protein